MTVELRPHYDVGVELADDPLVVVVDDFVTPAECEHIIKLARPKMERSKVTKDESVEFSAGRTGSTAFIPHDATPVVRKLVGRVSELVGIPASHAESLQIVHYAETQEYKPHFDGWKVGTERHANRTSNGGQRMVTALMYLNAVDAGGGTGFPKLDLEVDPVPGRMVIFHNATGPDHDRHERSLHGGLPVHYGEKWACNLWFRERPYTRPGRSPGAKAPRPGAGKARAKAKKKRRNQRAARRRNR